MLLPTLLTLTLLITTTLTQGTVYLIRHGEKPSSGGNGLSTLGVERSQCLVHVFGDNSNYNIDYILAQHPKKNGKRARPYDTVKPLADSLGLEVDTTCERDDYECVANIVRSYEGSGNILICWEHDALTDIVQSLGAEDPPTYPGNEYNLIWTDPKDYENGVTSVGNECCPGLDDC